jgi:hypothetical protein
MDEKEDDPKTSFKLPSVTHCYLRMLEGPKNASERFSRMVIIVLSSQIGKNMLTYMYDIIFRRLNRKTTF